MTISTSRSARPGHHAEAPARPDHTGPASAGPDTTGADTTGPDYTGPENTGPDNTGPDNTGPDNCGHHLIGGRYRLAGPIGRGAMGTVWRARDELLDREVAVKEVRLPASVSDAERANSYQRTLREARTAARLSHPGVAAVYDVVEEFGRPWIVMELVPARALDQVVAEDGPLPPVRAADMGRQVLAALTTAHAAGVLHRDVKPSNVLLAGDGRAVLTDFGIATAEGDPSLTQTGMVMGSPGFLAPERIRGGAATPASDLWSLGATLYAAVEGQGPYDRHGGVMTTMAAVVMEDPRPPRAAGPLTPVISALLSRDPAQRPSASAAARMLDAIGGTGGRQAALPWATTAPPDAGSEPGQAHGTLRLAETLRPSAILPPGASPPGPQRQAAPGAPGPVRAAAPMPPAPMAPPPVTPAPMAPPPVTPAPMAPPYMTPAPMAPALMTPRPMATHPMGPAPVVPTPVARPPAALPPTAPPPTARPPTARPPMGPGPMATPPLGPAGALGPTSMGPASMRGAPPRHRHRAIIILIIGAAVFVLAALAAAQIHKAGSDGTAPQQQSPGAAQDKGTQGRQAAAGSHGRGRPHAASGLTAGRSCGFPLVYATGGGCGQRHGWVPRRRALRLAGQAQRHAGVHRRPRGCQVPRA